MAKSRLRKLQPSLIADRTAVLLRSAGDKAILRVQRWVRGLLWRRHFNDRIKRKTASAILIQYWYRYHKARKRYQLAHQFRLNKLKTRGLKAWRTTFTAQHRLRTAAMSQLRQWTWFQAHLACKHVDFQAIRPLRGVFEMASEWREWRKAARCVTLWKLVSAQR